MLFLREGKCHANAVGQAGVVCVRTPEQTQSTKKLLHSMPKPNDARLAAATVAISRQVARQFADRSAAASTLTTAAARPEIYLSLLHI